MYLTMLTLNLALPSPTFFFVSERVFMGVQPDEARVADLKQKLEGKLQGYERILGERKYLAGDVSECSVFFT